MQFNELKELAETHNHKQNYKRYGISCKFGLHDFVCELTTVETTLGKLTEGAVTLVWKFPVVLKTCRRSGCCARIIEKIEQPK